LTRLSPTGARPGAPFEAFVIDDGGPFDPFVTDGARPRAPFEAFVNGTGGPFESFAIGGAGPRASFEAFVIGAGGPFDPFVIGGANLGAPFEAFVNGTGGPFDAFVIAGARPGVPFEAFVIGAGGPFAPFVIGGAGPPLGVGRGVAVLAPGALDGGSGHGLHVVMFRVGPPARRGDAPAAGAAPACHSARRSSILGRAKLPPPRLCCQTMPGSDNKAPCFFGGCQGIRPGSALFRRLREQFFFWKFKEKKEARQSGDGCHGEGRNDGLFGARPLLFWLVSVLAASKIGPAGKAIGIDMTSEMLQLARQNAARGNNGQGFTNVEFHQATIDNLPLPAASVDCVISNCVINLANKPAVFREIVRVLKPGMAYVGCIAGAILIDEYRRQLAEAGFAAVQVIETGADLNAYAKVENQSGCCAPAPRSLPVAESGCCSAQPSDDGLHRRLLELLRRYNVNEYAASVRVFAVKP
jgi:arsenite methyltransferase